MRSLRVAALALALLAPTTGLFAQTVTLRYRWTKGEELRYRLTVLGQTSMSSPGSQGVSGLPGSMSSDQKITQTVRLVVDDVAADGTATLRQIIEGVRIEVNGPNLPGVPAVKRVFDTTDGGAASAPDQVALSGIVGKAITVVMSPTGAVLKTEGMAELVDGLVKGLSQNVPATAGALDAIKKSFSDQALAGMQGFTLFPDRALKPGDSWDRQRSVNNPMAGKTTTSETVTLQRIEGNVAHITISSTTKQDDAGATPPFLPPNAQMQMHMDDTVAEGEVAFDMATGRMQRFGTNTTGSITMTMSMAGQNGASATTMTMSTRNTMSIVMELVGP